MANVAVLGMALLGACAEKASSAGPAAQGAIGGALDCPDERDEAADAVIASWPGGHVTWGDVHGRIEGDLRTMQIQYEIDRYELESQTLDQMITEQLLANEAKRAGEPDVETLLEHQIEDKVPDPTEAEVQAFYPMVQRQLGGATLEEARPYLAQELKRRAQSDAYETYVAMLKGNAGVTASIPYPELPRIDVPVAADDPVRGAPDAPVTIVQFAEFQCYYCNKVSPTLDQVLAKYPGKVRVVWKDFPLSAHSRAVPAAVAAHCAGEQDKFWEMNQTLLQNQGELGDADLSRYARELGLDGAKFEECAASGRYDGKIQGSLKLGRDIGVSATPGFFIDGITVSGAQPIERFSAIIDHELAAQANSSVRR